MKAFYLLLAGAILLAPAIGLRLQAQPPQPPDKKAEPKEKDKELKEKKAEPKALAIPLEINDELKATDDKDAEFKTASKKFTVKLEKDKAYVIEMISKDFDSFLRLLDRVDRQLAEDDDSGGDLNALILYTAKKTAEHQIVAVTLDGQLGKFTLKVREFSIKGEAKPRVVGDGINIKDQIGAKDKTDVGKRGKFYSVELKAGTTYTIDLASQKFDSYLYLFDGKNKVLAQDDDSGGNLDARIVFRPERDGVYHILASSLDGGSGEFTLSVRKNDKDKE